MFRKKHAPHMHAHHPQHAHAHTHDFIYASVYTYIHCSRKGHLVKLCYYRLNTSNFVSKHVWVRKGANPHGPKKVWVSKSSPIVIFSPEALHLNFDDD